MKKILLSACLLLTGLVASLGAQLNGSEHARRAAEKLAGGDRAGAIAVLDQAIAERKDLQETYPMRARLRLGNGDLDGSLADFTEAIKLLPHNATLYEQRAQVRGLKRDYAGALEDFDAAIANGLKTEKVYLQRADIKQRMGDVDGALADFRFVIAAKPLMAGAHTALAVALERKGDVDAAIVLLEDFLDRYEGRGDAKKQPASPAPTAVGESVFVKGEGKDSDGKQAYRESQQFVVEARTREEAIKQAAQYEQRLNHGLCYTTLGRLYLKKNDLDRALVNLEKALKINGKDDLTTYKLRSNVRIRQGNLQGAIEDLTVVVNAPAGGFISHLDKGLLLLLKGQDAEAEKEFALHGQEFPRGVDFMNRAIEDAKKLRAQTPTTKP
ncbi:MAG: hypothetical protein QOD32_3245 [Pyrinomonadaceae bacterium]|jgi:tetratricopeptide (TPR) repeat protein|nr:hypothetical protein [Pyrinomonadaceae bacterium]